MAGRTPQKQRPGTRPLWDAWREHGLVFASTIGTPIEPRNVNRRWDELRRKAGLDWLRLHDLHGCATFLLAQGVPARAIMEVLGHAEIGVTMNTYMSCRCFARRRPTRLTSCSEREVSGFGYSLGYSKGRFMIASGLWPGEVLTFRADLGKRGLAGGLPTG